MRPKAEIFLRLIKGGFELRGATDPTICGLAAGLCVRPGFPLKPMAGHLERPTLGLVVPVLVVLVEVDLILRSYVEDEVRRRGGL